MSALNMIPMKPVEHVKTDDGIPYVTHEGIFQIGDIQVKVYQLNTGQRIIDANDPIWELLFNPPSK